MSDAIPDQVAHLISLAQTVLDKENDKKIRIEAFHKMTELMTWRVLHQVRQDGHEDLFDKMTQVFEEAIVNYQTKEMMCCDEAIECIGTGFRELNIFLPVEQIFGERVSNSIGVLLDILQHETISNKAMHEISSTIGTWIDDYHGYLENTEHRAYDEALDKYSEKFAECLNSLEMKTISGVTLHSLYIREIAIEIPAFISRLEQTLVSSSEQEAKEHVASVAIRLLAIANREKMEDLLGRGFLAAAKMIKVSDYGDDTTPSDATVAWILEDVINEFPACKHMLKSLLHGATARRARLAATIVIPPTRPAVYHLKWEDGGKESATEDESESEEEPATVTEWKKVDSQGFDSLPLEVLVQIVASMDAGQIRSFRATCTQAYSAVQSYFNKQIHIRSLINNLWHEQNDEFPTLAVIIKEVHLLLAWASKDGVELIDFRGVATMSNGQLEAAFGTEPMDSVTTINLSDVIVLPATWKALARLFPAVTTVIITEATVQFRDGINDRKVALENGEQLKRAGLLDDKRSRMLSDLVALFSKLQKVQME